VLINSDMCSLCINSEILFPCIQAQYDSIVLDATVNTIQMKT